MDVLQFPGHIPGLAVLHVGPGFPDALHHAVGFRRGGEKNGRMGQRQLGLGQPQLHGSIHAGFHNGDRLRIGHAHILAGGAEEPAAGSHQIPGLQEASQVVERRVRVAAPQGLHQGGGQVIHCVAAPVIAHGAALGHLLHIGKGQSQRPVPGLCRLTEELHRVDGLAHIAAAGGGNGAGHPLLPAERQGGAGLLDGKRPLHRDLHLLRLHGLELKDRGPGEEGAVDIEIGVLRGGGDEGQLTVLHEFQQGLLLLLVEVLDLIQVEEDAAGSQERPHIRDDVLDVLKGGGGGIEPVEGLMGALGDEVRHRSLSGARRAVEDHIYRGAALNEPAQHRALPQKVLLSHHLVQCLGADLVRQGPLHGGSSSHASPVRSGFKLKV